MTRARALRSFRALLLACLLVLSFAAAHADEHVKLDSSGDGTVSIVVRNTPVAEVFEMLARKERVSILLGDDVEGKISVNLFDVSLDHAVRAIAEAAGYVAERRRGGYVILERDEAGKDVADGNTQVRSFKIQYSDPEEILPIVEKYLSRYGEATVLAPRRMLVVEDLPDFVQRIGVLLAELDRDPHQILIEARIMEITLDDSTAFGIDWSYAFGVDDGSAAVGVRDFVPGGAGLFFDLLTSDTEVSLVALAEKGRMRTLSTPRLLTLENQEAEVVIGDRLGYRVTTTINQVTTESVEFLESGVILRVTAAVDRQGRVVLDIHPEVSLGSIDADGLPAQNTTEVTTSLVTESGSPVFIAGLISERETNSRDGIPLLSDIPLLGRLFSRTQTDLEDTETVVVLRATVVNQDLATHTERYRERALETEQQLEKSLQQLDDNFMESGSGPAAESPFYPSLRTPPHPGG